MNEDDRKFRDALTRVLTNPNASDGAKELAFSALGWLLAREPVRIQQEPLLA